jgi:hypothetical protein
VTSILLPHPALRIATGTFVASGHYALNGSPKPCPEDQFASAPRLKADASGCLHCPAGFTTNRANGSDNCGEKRDGVLRQHNQIDSVAVLSYKFPEPVNVA